jgi:hypothetical protein
VFALTKTLTDKDVDLGDVALGRSGAGVVVWRKVTGRNAVIIGPHEGYES